MNTGLSTSRMDAGDFCPCHGGSTSPTHCRILFIMAAQGLDIIATPCRGRFALCRICLFAADTSPLAGSAYSITMPRDSDLEPPREPPASVDASHDFAPAEPGADSMTYSRKRVLLPSAPSAGLATPAHSSLFGLHYLISSYHHFSASLSPDGSVLRLIRWIWAGRVGGQGDSI
jgi:hypothetical protein